MKKIFKAVMLAVLGVAMVFGGMALLNLNVDASTSTNCGTVIVRPPHSGLGQVNKHCSLSRTMRLNNGVDTNFATAGTTAANSGGQVRVHVYFMQQPNGVPVTVAMNPNASNDSGWANLTHMNDTVRRDANNGTAGRNQQVQARHWFRHDANQAATITHTILNR